MTFLAQPLSFISIGPQRSISGQGIFLTGYITINETTTDQLTITKQPVQQGASISDHAYLEPTNLALQIQFASQGLIQAIGGLFGGLFGGQSLPAIYQQLLALQQPQVAPQSPLPPGFTGPPPPPPVPTLQPFSVTTPKRTYTNMLLAVLTNTTDKKTENLLSISATFQQVLIVPVTTALVPRSQLSNPGSNGATQNVGQKASILFNATQPLAGKPLL